MAFLRLFIKKLSKNRDETRQLEVTSICNTEIIYDTLAGFGVIAVVQ